MAANDTTLSRGLGLLLAAGSLVNAIQGIRTGEVGAFHSRVKRADDPVQFWFAILVSVLAAVAFLVLLFTGHFDL